jgi:DNA-binding response OmpR family regulator
MQKGTRRVSDGGILFVVSDRNTAEEFRAHFESRYHYKSEEAFYEILVETHGDAALEICSKEFLLMAVLDVDLPDINGYELAKRMRKQLDRSLPFVFLAGSDRRADDTNFSEFKREYHVTKPFTMEEVEQGIRTTRTRVHIQYWRNPWTRLLSGQAIENECQTLLNRRNWVLLCTS